SWPAWRAAVGWTHSPTTKGSPSRTVTLLTASGGGRALPLLLTPILPPSANQIQREARTGLPFVPPIREVPRTFAGGSFPGCLTASTVHLLSCQAVYDARRPHGKLPLGPARGG